ncbi:MAG: hypothetical protein JXX29_07485 [Deltaproteobacteria bacterium]|nr:hypothetical protein [Deltaproteobacteria bacterium]MBN2671498.1 hypothetical protein [Deltaproteobacteria bacterium]
MKSFGIHIRVGSFVVFTFVLFYLNSSCSSVSTRNSRQHSAGSTSAVSSNAAPSDEGIWKPIRSYGKTVSFCGQQIPEDSVIASCMTGRRMDIKHLEPRDLEKLSELPNLEMLSIFTEDDVDLRYIGKLKALTYLAVNADGVKNVEDLAKLTRLTHLFFRFDEERMDYSFLGALKKLHTLFFVEVEESSNTSAIANVRKLQHLSICHASNETLNALRKNRSIESLSLHFQRSGTALSPIRSLKKLVSFNTDFIDEDGLQHLRELKKLQTLTIGFFEGRNLDALRQLTQLRVLSLATNDLEDLSALRSLRSLRVLSVVGSHVKKLEPLSSLENLRYLTISDAHRLVAIEPLRHMKKLRYLDVTGTKVDDLQTVRTLTGLRFLNYSHLADSLKQWAPRGDDNLNIDGLYPDELLYEMKMGTLPAGIVDFPFSQSVTDTGAKCVTPAEFKKSLPFEPLTVPSFSYDIGILPGLAVHQEMCRDAYLDMSPTELISNSRVFGHVDNYGFFLIWLLKVHTTWKIMGTTFQMS